MKKRQTWGMAILLGCLILPCGALVRATDETLILIAEENKVKAELSPPDNTDIVSLQLSFQIDMPAEDAEKGQVSFEFDSGIDSGVKQYRYRPETGVLTVYISGREALFAAEKLNDKQALTLGNVVLEPNVTADVRVREGSLVTMVNDAFDLQRETLISSGAHVDAKGGNTEQPGQDNVEDWRPVEDVVNPGGAEENPGGAQNPGGTQTPGSAGENPGGADINPGGAQDPGNVDITPGDGQDPGSADVVPDGAQSGGSNGVWYPQQGGENIARPEDARPEGGWTGYRPTPENTVPADSGPATEPVTSTPVVQQPSVVPSGGRGILSAYKQLNQGGGTAGTEAAPPVLEAEETVRNLEENGEKDTAPEEVHQPQNSVPNRGQMILRVEKPKRPQIGTVAKVLLGAGLSALLALGVGMALIMIGDHRKRMRRLQRLHNKRKRQF